MRWVGFVEKEATVDRPAPSWKGPVWWNCGILTYFGEKAHAAHSACAYSRLVVCLLGVAPYPANGISRDPLVVEWDPESLHLHLKHPRLDRGIVRSELGRFFEVGGLENRHAAIG
jgi:hypothetical protein